MQRCTFCGTELPNNARFCVHCGQTLNPLSMNGHVEAAQHAPQGVGQPEEDLAQRGTHPLATPGEQEQELSRVPTSNLVVEDVHTPSNELPAQQEQVQPGSIPPDLPRTDTSQEYALPVADHDDESSQVSSIPTSKLNGASTPPAITQEPELAVATPQGPSPSGNASNENDIALPVTPPQQPVAPAGKPKRSSRRLLLTLGLVAVIIIAGAVALLLVTHPFSTGNAGSPVVVTSPTSDTVPTAAITPCSNGSICPNTPNPLNNSTFALTLSNAVSGSMMVTSVIACGVEQSAAGGQQYHVSVLGIINKQAYGFSFDAYPYTKPGIYTDVVTSFFGPAGDSSSLTQWRTVSTQTVSVVVNSDAKSGTLNINLENNSDHSMVNVVGTWTCA